MIEPDINERMARFAPSQNMGDAGDDAIERAVAGMAGMPARPQFEQDADIDAAVLQIAGERRQDMAASLMAASQVNPDQAARASKLGDQFGVGQDIALRNMQELEREATVRDIQRMDLMRNDPVLARYLSDRAFASEAQDDVGILAKLRPVFVEAALVAAQGPLPVLSRGYERGSAIAERGAIGTKAMVGLAQPEDLEQAKRLQQRMQSLGQMGILGTTAEMIGQNVAQLRGIGTTAVAGAGVGSFFGPAGTAVGGALGATAGVIATTAEMEAGNLYLDLQEEGVSEETAIPVAIAGGFLNGVIEVVGMKVAAKPFQALAQRVMREAVADAIKKPTMRSALAAAGKGYLMQVGAEGAEEALQETVIIAGEEIAKAIDGVDSETGMREAVDRVLESFMYGAMGASILGGIGPGANLFVDLRRASNTERQQRFFEGLAANNKESRLAQRSPVAYERFLEAQAEGAQAETIYVDGRIAQQVLAQSGVPTAQLEEILPGIRERISEAVQTGGDVTIPTARFGARLANTELGNALLPHMRLSPDAMSATEAQEFATRRQDVVREAEQILAQKQEADATFVQQARQIEDTLASQIVATGQMDEKAARSSAQFMRDFYVTQAAALGMSPQQVYERFPVRVEGAMPGTAAAPMAQAAQKTLADVEKAFAELNVEQRLTETDTAIRPGIIRVPQELRAQGRATNAMQQLIAYADQVGKRIDVSPTAEFGANKKRLVEWYKSLGFVENKGRNKDFAISATMYRVPQPAAPGIMEQAAVQRGEPATLERLQMQAQRGVRRQARKVELSPTEEAAIATAASEFGESAADIREAVLNHKKAHPTTQGWAPLEFVKLSPKKIEDKGKKGLGLEKLDLQYQQIPYGFHRDANGKPLQPATPEYQAAVASVARRMVDEVRAVAARAAAGDQNAVRIINQSTWYKAMRTALRREFGGLGDLFADLLGATSPNTPVRGNWDFALDVLRRAARGDFDAIITKWEAWVETIERLETDLRAYVNDEQRAMEARGEKVSQAAIQRKPEYIEKFKALKEARNLPDELLPRQENGKKYGFNGGNVVRAMVGLWRTVREQNTLLGTTAQAPKALNFSGNLIGFRARATIDVWAARMLQRLAALLRIPSMAETGVAGEMLPDGSTTGQFGFGQDVFAEAAQRIRNDAELNQNPQLAQLNDDDLQALVWFIEKELWTINNWTSVAGEGGSFELEASLAGISDREMVTQLRKTIDAGVPTKIREAASRLPAAQQAKLNWYLDPAKAGWRQRIDAIRAELDAVPTTLTKKAQRELRAEISKRLDAALQKSGFTKLEQALNDAITADMKLAAIEEARKAAQAKLISMERRVDRYTAGLSQQQSLDSQGVDYVPTDADQARLADNVRLRAYRADPGELLVAIKSMSTEGRYGSIERSIDLEVIARQGWSPSELWQVMLEEARDARQESTFLSRVLRADEAIDPARHRPGLEIYFRSPIPRDKLDALIEKLNANGVDFFTVIVDARRSTAARSGAMADAVGIRMQYVPEFMQRYGIEDFSGLSDAEIADRVKAKEAEWLVLADQVLRVMPEVSFAGVFWHETRVAFADAYESEIDAITTGTTTGDSGLLAGTQWAGQSVSEGLAAANRFVESRATQAEPDGGGQVPGGVQEGDRVGFAEPGVGTVFEQAATGPARGGFDPKRLTTILNKTADLSTFLHESAHAFLTFYEQVAATPDAPARIVNDMDELLRWFKIDGATPAERIANWNGLTLDQKRKYHETFAYNFEVYLFDGKAPSTEMQGLFERFSAWLKRVYRSIRDDLNAIYRREFGEDLPILTGEVRQVMDRMLATDEQIKRQAAINEMKPQFQTQEQSGMDDAEWAAYQAMQQEAIEASVTDMNKASMRQLQWLGNARSRILRDMQKKHDAKRKEVAAEVAAELRVEPVYRAMTYLRTGKFIDSDGAEVTVEGPHRLDTKRVQAIYENLPTEKAMEAVRATGMAIGTVFAPDIAKLGTGKYGMLGVDGLDPDVVAETFGFGSGDQMIRALLAAKPMKEAVAERTDAEMLRRFGDMNTPEAQEAEVQKALHNEARARFVAVELRHVARATEPVRVMLEAAKQVARELIAGMTLREVRPADFIAAEARAARDAGRMGTTVNPEAVGQAAQTRAYNEAIDAGTDPAEAMAAAIEKGAEAARKAQERSDALKAQYGADTQQALIRAKRAQLYQNQLAAEALRVREEVAKQVKYLRRILRDTNVKAMGAQAADQIAALLERFEVAPVSLKRLDERRALVEWLAQQAELGLVPDIAPEIVNEARRVNYREVKVSEFRDLVDAIRQIEHIGKRERKAAQEKLRAEFDALKDEAIQSMKDVAAKRGRKARKELGDEDRKWAQLIAGYDAMQQTIGSIVYVLDGGQRDGPLARMLLFTANDAGNQETTDRADATLALSKILDPIERKGQFSGRKLYFPQIDDSLSLEQRMVVALNYGNQSNIDRLLNGEKWTEEQVQPILESLTEEQLNAVQAIWNYLESFKPRVAAQERNLLGREPNWIEPRPFTVRSADGKVVNMAGGYYPAKYNPRRSSMSREMDESVEADRQMREAITAATTTRSYTKNRLDKPPEGGVLSRQMGGLYAGVNEVIHDLAWRTWAMDANRLLRDKEFQTVINSIYGRETYAAIKNWVDATVRGERGNYDVIENIAIGVRRNVSVSAMGLKFITAAIQGTGLIPATVRTGITPMVRAVAYFAANPRESSRIAREKSSFMRNRGRTRYRDLNEIANIVRGESRARRAYLANAYALIGLQQGMVDMSVWWAAYSKAIKEGKAEDTAVSIADQTVIDTQGSGMLKDLSQAMRGGQKQSAYAKLFTSFYQFSNTQYALLSAQLRTAPSMGKAAADAFTILVVGAFIEEMLRTLLKPSPDEEEPEDLAKALIANQIDFVIGLPFGGGELRGIGDMIVGEQAMQYRGPSGLRMVGEIRTFAGQTLQGEFDRAWTRSAINMSGLIWGIPSAQINDTIDGINAAVESEVEGAEAVLAPITGVRR